MTATTGSRRPDIPRHEGRRARATAADYEQPTYETTAGGTRTSGTVTAFRNRGGESIGFTVRRARPGDGEEPARKRAGRHLRLRPARPDDLGRDGDADLELHLRRAGPQPDPVRPARHGDLHLGHRRPPHPDRASRRLLRRPGISGDRRADHDPRERRQLRRRSARHLRLGQSRPPRLADPRRRRRC